MTCNCWISLIPWFKVYYCLQNLLWSNAEMDVKQAQEPSLTKTILRCKHLWQTIHWASPTEATNIRTFPTAEISVAFSLTLLEMFVVLYNCTLLYLKFYQKWSQNKQLHIPNILVIALSRSGQWLYMILKAFSNLDYSNCTHINKWQPFTTMAATGE